MDSCLKFFEKLYHFQLANSQHASATKDLFASNGLPSKPFHFCPLYSLIVGLGSGLCGCVNSPAVFSVVDQQLFDYRLGISTRYKLVVTVKCVYLNSEDSLECYLFNVALDLYNPAFSPIRHIAANLNGSALLLSSDRSCYLATTPYELSEFADCPAKYGPGVFLRGTLAGELILSRQTLSQNLRNVVKVQWHPHYSNTFVIATNEAVAGTVKADPDGTFRAAGGCAEYSSFVRVFILDQSIDDAARTIRIPEAMCKTGRDEEPGGMVRFSPKLGAVVDFFFNPADDDPLGALTLFVLTNYGLVLCYAPVTLTPVYDFRKNSAVVSRALKLLETGFEVEVASVEALGGQGDRERSKRDLAALSVREAFFGDEPVEYRPVAVRLVGEHEFPDASGSYPLFEAFTVMSSSPLRILAADSANLLLYEPELELYPHTAKFYNRALADRVHECRHSHIASAGADRRFRLAYLSKTDCLLYSSREYRHVHHAAGLTVEPFVGPPGKTDAVYSEPLVFAPGAGALGPGGAQPASSVVVGYKYARDAGGGALTSLLVYRLVHKAGADQTGRAADGEAAQAQSEEPKFEEFVRPNRELFAVVAKTNKAVSGYKEIFAKLREINESKPFKEKVIPLMKELARLHAEVAANLEWQPELEQAVDEAVSRSNQLAATVDEYVERTEDDHERMVADMEARFGELNARSAAIAERQADVARLMELYQSVHAADAAMTAMSDTISDLYLRFSRILVGKAEELVRATDYPASYEGQKQRMIGGCGARADEWFRDRLRENVDLMEDVLNGVKTLRATIETIR